MFGSYKKIHIFVPLNNNKLKITIKLKTKWEEFLNKKN
jgi:hypothetical protein